MVAPPPLAPDIQTLHVQILHFLPGPWGFAQKGQAGFDRGIVGKTVDPDEVSQLGPTVKIDQFSQDHLQGFTVERVVGLHRVHFSRFALLQNYTEFHGEAQSYTEKNLKDLSLNCLKSLKGYPSLSLSKGGN